MQASHIGLGVNPVALYALADRLAQPAGGWQPQEAVTREQGWAAFTTGAA